MAVLREDNQRDPLTLRPSSDLTEEMDEKSLRIVSFSLCKWLLQSCSLMQSKIASGQDSLVSSPPTDPLSSFFHFMLCFVAQNGLGKEGEEMTFLPSFSVFLLTLLSVSPGAFSPPNLTLWGMFFSQISQCFQLQFEGKNLENTTHIPFYHFSLPLFACVFKYRCVLQNLFFVSSSHLIFLRFVSCPLHTFLSLVVMVLILSFFPSFFRHFIHHNLVVVIIFNIPTACTILFKNLPLPSSSHYSISLEWEEGESERRRMMLKQTYCWCCWWKKERS